MQLDYNANVNEYGDNIVRFYDFDMAEAEKFKLAVQEAIIINKKPLDIAKLDFIQARNCNLILRISDEDLGIESTDNVNFFCDLTLGGYKQMVSLLEPFCKRETTGYQWLYDVDSSTDLLFSPGGTW
jgi:hypothetical protein